MRLILIVALWLTTGFFSQEGSLLAQEAQEKTDAKSIENLKKPVVDPILEKKLHTVTAFVEGAQVQDCATSIVRGKCVFLWAPAHFVEPSREIITVTNLLTGKEESRKVLFDPIAVRKICSDRTLELQAHVVRYDRTRDLALLRVTLKNDADAKNFTSVKFGYLKDPPPKGLSVCHLLPKVDKKHRLLPSHVVQGVTHDDRYTWEKDEQVYSRATLYSIAGSGGGCVFCPKTGDALGMIVASDRQTVTLFVSSHEMLQWARAKGVAWAIDPTVPMPSEVELKKLPIED